MKKEHPILFNDPMVRAILEDRKTVTRRPVKPQPSSECNLAIYDPAIGWRFRGGPNVRCSYGIPGDRLWVRETWQHNPFGGIVYRAGSGIINCDGRGWKPSIHMPRWASRIIMEVVNVQVERLQEMHHKAEEFTAEGIALPRSELFPEINRADKLERHFIKLWDSMNGEKCPWESNPWVWVIQFKRVNPWPPQACQSMI